MTYSQLSLTQPRIPWSAAPWHLYHRSTRLADQPKRMTPLPRDATLALEKALADATPAGAHAHLQVYKRKRMVARPQIKNCTNFLP